MSDSAVFWLLLTLISIFLEAFYVMSEMACVSFNKARLQLYLNQGSKRATWIYMLLRHPANLFGTTLIFANVTLQFGSECSRQLYHALGLSPDLAPLTQIVIVVIFAELSPMIAARRHAESVTMLSIPFLYASSKILAPATWLIDIMVRLINRLFFRNKTTEPSNYFLSREELQRIFEKQEDIEASEESKEINALLGNIFNFHEKAAGQVMEPLNAVQMAPSNCTAAHMRALLEKSHYDHLPVYYGTRTNIIGIAFPRNMVRLDETHKIRDTIKTPWFISHNSKVLDVLRQFRTNKETVAVVLDDAGNAVGILSRDDILEEIFGKPPAVQEKGEARPEKPQRLLELHLPAHMKVADFNEQFHAELPEEDAEDLKELIMKRVGHVPVAGESVLIGDFEMCVEETTLLGIKTVLVRSVR